jgi:N-acetylmuramoyl-L-alanine amidase
MKIALTAGHSDIDPGAVNPRLKLREEDLATELRDMIAFQLRQAGHEVLEDGPDGKNQSLSDAVKLAAQSDIAVEIHFNASDNPKASGVETISNNHPKNKRLAIDMSCMIAGALKSKLRGTAGWIPQEKSQHKRLAFVQAGGLIVEVAFISNDADMMFFLGRKSTVADAIVDAILHEINERGFR